MTQTKRFSARVVLLATGTAGFVALGAGVAGAEDMKTPMHEIAPVVERALVEGVAPTMNELAPQGLTPVAGNALSELQDTANNTKPAPDLGAVLPDSPLADAAARTQDATGLDGDPHDTVGQAAGRALEASAEDTSVALEDTARETGTSVEDAATEVLPHTVVAVTELRDEMLTLPDLDAPRVPELSEAPSLPEVDEVTELTGSNALVLDELGPLGGQGATLPMSHSEAAAPTAPNMWDLAAAFGLETPDQIQDVVESTELTEDNYVNLGEEEVLGMVGNRAWEDRDLTVPQSSAGDTGTPEAPGVQDLTDAVVSGVSEPGAAETVSLDGPLSEAQLPRVAEGIDTTTAEDLVNGLGRGDLLGQVDTSDLVSVEGGTAEQETPEGMVEHPTFMDLPGSEALPVIS
ncbi:hypothetical protein ACWFMI_07305 [Nocardiopsis terrae]